jgi:phytoene synthase
MSFRGPIAVLVPDAPIGASRARTELSIGGSSFYAAMRVLPPAQRNAMFEIYRFCRAVDDVADGRSDRASRLAELSGWRADIRSLFDGVPPARVHALAGPVCQFDLQRGDFLSIIDGMEMDARMDICAPDLAMLELYCDRVACAVGRLSVRVFGVRATEGVALAAHLGRALQFTNILRDLDEDAANGRLYLPREDLLAAGIAEVHPSTVLAHPALGRVCAMLVGRARDHFAAAGALMAREPAQVMRAPRLMAEVYRLTLERLVQRGWAAPRRPVRIGRGERLWIVLRHGLLA